MAFRTTGITNRMTSLALALVAVWHIGVVGAAASEAAEMPERDGGSRWGWRLGPALRTGGAIEARWDSDSVASRIPKLLGGQSGGGNPPVGSAGAYADRTYADGYVRLDPGTMDPETDTYGMTWYWGYQNAGQRRGDTVVFRSSPVEEYGSGFFFEHWEGRDEPDFNGVDAELSRILLRRGRAVLEVVAGMSWYDTQSSRFAVRRRGSVSAWRYVDTYAAPYTPFPSAPYSGSYDGPGYLINNRPDSRTVEQTGGRESDWEAVSVLNVDTDMLDARLGLGLRVDFGILGLRLTPQLRAAFVRVDAAATTTVSPLPGGNLEFNATESEDVWIFGAGAEAEARLRFWRSWMVSLAASADWWAENVSVRAEPFDVELELGQWTFTAGLGSAF